MKENFEYMRVRFTLNDQIEKMIQTLGLNPLEDDELSKVFYALRPGFITVYSQERKALDPLSEIFPWCGQHYVGQFKSKDRLVELSSEKPPTDRKEYMIYAESPKITSRVIFVGVVGFPRVLENGSSLERLAFLKLDKDDNACGDGIILVDDVKSYIKSEYATSDEIAAKQQEFEELVDLAENVFQTKKTTKGALKCDDWIFQQAQASLE